jgi:PAS domain S-box-containing protein
MQKEDSLFWAVFFFDGGGNLPMERDIYHYRAIVEQMPEAVIFADRGGLIRIWNRGAEAVFGFSAAEVLGRRLDVIIPAALRERHWRAYDQAMATGVLTLGDRVLTTRSLRKDGAVIYVDLSFAVVRGGDGGVEGALGVGRDATERYLAGKAQKKLIAELEKRLRDASCPAE